MKNILFLILIAVLAVGFVWLWSGYVDTYNVAELDENDDVSAVPDAPMEPQPFSLALRSVEFGDGKTVAYRLADDFEITVAAEGLGKARFMTMSPDGRLFVPDLVNYNLSGEGSIIVLEDFNELTRRFETQTTYLSGLRGPHSVAFYTDKSGEDWLYVALTDRLVRYRYERGATAPSSEAETVVTFPNEQSPTATGVVWHITRTVLFDDDTLYVSVGSGCNACEQPEDEERALILTMEPDGDNVRVYADGLRNAVGLVKAGSALYATENGVDHLGADAPDDVFYRLERGEHYGWPYCYELDGEVKEDTTRAWEDKTVSCSNVPLSLAAFDPHTAPLGVEYFENAHPVLNNTFLAALHGSFREEIGNGYQLVRITKEGEQEIFMDGFLGGDGERRGRPVDVLQRDNDSFFVTDDHNGVVYYLYALP